MPKKPKKAFQGKFAGKAKPAKPRYRKPSQAQIDDKLMRRDLSMRMELMELKMDIVREQQAAFFSVLQRRQKDLVLAYEEE